MIDERSLEETISEIIGRVKALKEVGEKTNLTVSVCVVTISDILEELVKLRERVK